jgi:high-affinity nickel-transport protein
VYYNLTITGLSVTIACVVGTLELLSVLADRLDLHGAVWDWLAGVDLNAVGYAILGLFVATWLVALAAWRFGRIGEQWSGGRRPVERPFAEP